MSSNRTYTEQAPGATGVDPQHPAHQLVRVLDADAAIIAPAVEGDAVRKKIALVGFAASTRTLAPFDDPAYWIVGLNQLYRHIPRADVWFDIHANWREDNVEGTDHPGWLAQSGLPVYMTQREPSIPTSVRYPIERAIAQVAGLDYFTSTVAFMIGWAILEFDAQVERDLAAKSEVMAAEGHVLDLAKARQIVADAYAERELAIFGIDLVVGTEYEHQKACAEFWIGIAHGRGINIVLPEHTALLRGTHIYGMEKEPDLHPVKLGELQKRHDYLIAERNKLVAQLGLVDGALQENELWLQVFQLRIRGSAAVLPI